MADTLELRIRRDKFWAPLGEMLRRPRLARAGAPRSPGNAAAPRSAPPPLPWQRGGAGARLCAAVAPAPLRAPAPHLRGRGNFSDLSLAAAPPGRFPRAADPRPLSPLFP